jgi:hypothetical protein
MFPSKLQKLASKLGPKSLAQLEKLADSLAVIEARVESKSACTYNFRIDLDDKELWAPTISPLINQYKKDIESKLSDPNQDLIYRSRYAQINPIANGFIRIFNGASPQSIVLSDFMMFNKNFDLNLNLVDRLLPYCKFSENKTINETYQLDGWTYSCPGFYECGSNKPHYSIKFDMGSYSSMGLLVTEEEKRLAVRAMIKIMNECDVQDINLNSYHVISEWYRINDMMINSYNSNLYGLEVAKKNANQAKEDHVQVPIKFNTLQRLTREEIIEILYACASNGSNDHYSIYGKPKLINLYQLDLSKPIEKIDQCVIGYNPSNLSQLDLSKYLEANGPERTGYVISQFEQMIKSRVNMNLWVKTVDGSAIKPEELLVELYNNLSPTGMGVVQWYSNPIKLTVESAKEILDKSDGYIDYLNGVAFKLNWSNYPILDIGRFEDRNGIGSFDKCLKNFICY